MRRTLLMFLGLVFFSTPSHASSACYTPAEMEAEQLLRLHSELMVITVTCHQGSDGQNLVPAYTGFTHNNLNLIRGAEQTMIGFYKKHYKGDPTARLDRLRTLLANEYGKQIADVSAPRFCASERDKVVTLYNYAPASILGEAKREQISAHFYAPLCGEQVARRAGRHG